MAPIALFSARDRACLDVILAAASAEPLGDQDPDLMALTREAFAAAGPGFPEEFARVFPDAAAINVNDAVARDDVSVATRISILDSSSNSVSEDSSAAPEDLIAKQLT